MNFLSDNKPLPGVRHGAGVSVMRPWLAALCAVFALSACTKRYDEKAARERDEQLMMQKLLEAAEQDREAADGGASPSPPSSFETSR
jgi:hypothetical protein